MIASSTRQGTAESRYLELQNTRNPYLEKARECAKYTLPMLFPPDGHSGSTSYPTPFQSLGAYGVKNLVSKLLLTLLPQSSPFFRLEIDELVLNKENPEDGFKAMIEDGLAKIERAAMKRIESSGDRVAINEMLTHLIIGGNVLIFKPPSGGMRVFHLDRFVVKRDPMGNPLEIITHEEVSPSALPPDFLESLREDLKKDGSTSDERTINIYTYIKRTPERWEVFQECCGHKIPDTSGHYPLDELPWLALRATRIDGEDYGRSYVEPNLGDLMSLEGLMQAIVEGSAAAARLIIMVKPGGTTDASTLENAPNGAIVEGNAEDVTVFQLQKYADFRVAKETIESLNDRLSKAFLLNSAVQRNAERVTAEEIRYMAAELEDALGGIYTLLSQEFQLPYTRIVLKQMENEKILPELPKDLVKPTIITGVDALSRSHDRNRLVQFIQSLGAAFGPTVIATYINPTEAIRRLATCDGIDPKGLVKTQEEIQQEQQQAMMQQMMANVAPNAVDAVGKAATQQKGNIPNG